MEQPPSDSSPCRGGSVVESIQARSGSPIDLACVSAMAKGVPIEGIREIGRDHSSDGLHVILANQVQDQRARIETLPSELFLYLSRFLDLAGLVILSTSTSRALRAIFSQFDRELLFLEPRHRLNLAEWREAARQIDEHVLRQPHCTESQSSCSVTGVCSSATPKQTVDVFRTMRELTRDESLIDLDLLHAVLVFLAGGAPHMRGCTANGATGKEMNLDVLRGRGVHQIQCLYLTGWHGIAGAFLIQQLRLRSSLRDVCTVVKTERADARIWQQAAADDRHLRCRTWGMKRDSHAQSRSVPTLDSRPNGSGKGSTEKAIFGDATPDMGSILTFEQCTSTQMIVQVGKRRPRRQGQPNLRGEGLQMGYQGYCIDTMTLPNVSEGAADIATKLPKVRVDIRGYSGPKSVPATVGERDGLVAESAPGNQDMSLGSNHRPCRPDAPSKKIHVILQGREETGAEGEDRKQNEEMYERSIVTCNHCKERIRF